MNWEAAYASAYSLQISNDAVNWTTVYSTTTGDGGTDDITGLNTSARYVRMYGTQRGTPYGYSLWEFKIYGNDSIIISYEYDKDNRPTKTILNNLKSSSNLYDALGRMTQTTVDTTTPYITTYSYLAGLNGSTTAKVGSITNNGNTRSYTYDPNGNIETMTKGSNVIQYFYNELNELIRENNQILNKTVVYAYDAGGNLLTKIDYPYTTGTLGTPTKTYSYAYGDANWKDKLTSYDGKAITYDAIGNPLTYDGWTYTWEAGRQLATMSKTGQSLSFKYNDSGIRTQKTVNGVTTKYHLNGDKVTLEDNGTDKLYYSYDAGGNLVSMNLNGTEYYYIRNAEGDIIGLFDSAGTQVASYVYDSWGKLISTTGTLASTVGVKNPYLYRGYRSDSETGLYYLQSRYYNPDWGRFINADGVVGTPGELLSANTFAYCKNNPVSMSDSDGLRPDFGDGTGRETTEELLGSLATIKASLGRDGEPNSVGKEYDKNGNLTKERWYGPDGRAVKDKHYTNHGNAKQHPKVPHEHDWGLGKNGDWNPGPWYSMPNNIGKGILFGGASVGAGYLIYRGVRMIPSLFPGLWWTIPINAAYPL